MMDIAFHLSPLMNGHCEYADLGLGVRKRHLSKGSVFTQSLPFTYQTFAFKKTGFDGADKLLVRMKRDITSFLFDHLEFFQAFDKVKVYYDDGQQAVSEVIHEAIRYTAVERCVDRSRTHIPAMSLISKADFACGIELTALKYDASEATATDAIFFGGSIRSRTLKRSAKENGIARIRSRPYASDKRRTRHHFSY
ncbi:MAG: ABC transporter [Gordonibacter pamelaeae]